MRQYIFAASLERERERNRKRIAHNSHTTFLITNWISQSHFAYCVKNLCKFLYMPTRVAASQAPSRTLATLRLLLFSLSTLSLCISPSLSLGRAICAIFIAAYFGAPSCCSCSTYSSSARCSGGILFASYYYCCHSAADIHMHTCLPRELEQTTLQKRRLPAAKLLRKYNSLYFSFAPFLPSLPLCPRSPFHASGFLHLQISSVAM